MRLNPYFQVQSEVPSRSRIKGTVHSGVLGASEASRSEKEALKSFKYKQLQPISVETSKVNFQEVFGRRRRPDQLSFVQMSKHAL